MQTQRLPGPGETILGHGFRAAHGGNRSNQAVQVNASLANGECGERPFMENPVSERLHLPQQALMRQLSNNAISKSGNKMATRKIFRRHIIIILICK